MTLAGVDTDQITLSDYFDTSLMQYFEPQYNYEGGYIYGGDQYYQGNKATRVTTTPTESGVDFTVTVPKTDTGTYYSHYRLVYYLTVKDLAALQQLKERAAHENDGKTQIVNTVNFDGIPATKSIDFGYSFLSKNQTKAATATDRTSSYSITVNADGLDINPHGDTLVLEDVMTNQILDLSTLAANPRDNVVFDYDAEAGKLIVTLPDNTPVTITYSSVVLGTGSTAYSNTASLFGQTRGTNSSVNITSSGTGSASVPTIRLVKHESGNLSVRLAGAVFQLYNSKPDGTIDYDNPVVNMNGTNATFTSDSRGIVMVRGGSSTVGWNLEEGTRYYLVETQAPDGYMLDPTPIPFAITANPVWADEYPDNFVLSVANSAVSGGYQLPQTGGTGTAVFYGIASLLVLLGVAGMIGGRRRARGPADGEGAVRTR